jgi:hypothetical protein
LSIEAEENPAETSNIIQMEGEELDFGSMEDIENIIEEEAEHSHPKKLTPKQYKQVERQWSKVWEGDFLHKVPNGKHRAIARYVVEWLLSAYPGLIEVDRGS